jgi:2,4-dienoyl-CoA reductase-like NADH-dependent reductase (Old Yellow Enzyme family)
LAGWTKRLTGRSVITVGSVGVQTEFRGAGAAAPKNPLVIRESVKDRLDYLAEQFLADEFDVVAVGRALVADPAWVAKARAGHLDQVVPFDRTQHSLSGA